RHVQGRVARTLPGGLERDDLGVRAALPLVPAFADDVAARRDDDGADDGVRPRRAAPALGELERALQVPLRHASSCTRRRYARGRSSIPKIALPQTIRSAPAS